MNRKYLDGSISIGLIDTNYRNPVVNNYPNDDKKLL